VCISIFLSSNKDSNEATYQLLQVPTADLHVALILIHALSELSGIHITVSCTPVVALGILSLRSNGTIVLSLFDRLARTAPEETTDSVAN
jgi:hypothetical protein